MHPIMISIEQSNDDILLLLGQAGFTNELVNLTNKHRACQCLIVHLVLKTRVEELQQLREGLESISLLQFLQICHNCIRFVFPSVDDITLKASDVLSLINKVWLCNLSGVQETVMKWFSDYVTELDQNNGQTGNIVLNWFVCLIFSGWLFCITK